MATLRFNTAIARITELTNHVTQACPPGTPVPRQVAEWLVLLVAPLAPHVAEELWSRLGHQESVAWAPFPVADERWLVDDTVEVAVQVNGKVRAQVAVPADADAAALEAAARADERVVAQLDGKTVRRVIAVPGRLVNFVVGAVLLLGLWFVGLDGVRPTAFPPLWTLFGGLLGATYVTLSLVGAAQLGVGVSTVAVTLGQVLGALLITAAGWFGQTPQRPTWTALLSAVLLLGAVGLLSLDRERANKTR